MNAISQAIINQIGAYAGYSVETLFSDLLDICFVPITYKEAAAYMGVDPKTVILWVSQGNLRKYGHGKATRLNKCEVIKFFQNYRPARPRAKQAKAEAAQVC